MGGRLTPAAGALPQRCDQPVRRLREPRRAGLGGLPRPLRRHPPPGPHPGGRGRHRQPLPGLQAGRRPDARLPLPARGTGRPLRAVGLPHGPRDLAGDRRPLPGPYQPRLHPQRPGARLGPGPLAPRRRLGLRPRSAARRRRRHPGRHHGRGHPPRRHGRDPRPGPARPDGTPAPCGRPAPGPGPAAGAVPLPPVAALPHPLGRRADAAVRAVAHPRAPLRPGPDPGEPGRAHLRDRPRQRADRRPAGRLTSPPWDIAAVPTKGENGDGISLTVTEW
ncbi:hypothetical protein SBRY_40432 [Actinacidiphila bryophytorum]|uniref:Uncharacterized protein n=1 Tax=Actinacidiphila bryophytorum TaxID=1436133 RepID=A0A9W4H2P3_9ACTN|nr:hypothetical protein SBRY_40432 [Actinacidiphila bryophytorum]